MAESASKKSTIVRLIESGLALGERWAPELAARWVCRQWFTLPRGPRPAELPPGGEAFTVAWQYGDVRGQVWGEDGPVVYLVHGWGGRSDQFASLVEPLRRAGYRVVVFDAPSHGASSPGLWGPMSTTGVEFSKALDAVFVRFGPAEAVVAHSMGALVTLLALDYGWLGTQRLVFLAPMSGYEQTMDAFQSIVGFGPRTRRRVDARTWLRVGLEPGQFELRYLWAGLAEPLPVLVVQDTSDPQAPYAEGRAIADEIGAEFMPTTGLGHNRILRDPAVADRIIDFLQPAESVVTLSATA